MVKERYHHSIDYFDLRLKESDLKDVDTHLFYCEDDQVIPFGKGEELEAAWTHASFVHVKGLGHYKIMANDSIISYISNSMKANWNIHNEIVKKAVIIAFFSKKDILSNYALNPVQSTGFFAFNWSHSIYFEGSSK